jgi:hypothetical protein
MVLPYLIGTARKFANLFVEYIKNLWPSGYFRVEQIFWYFRLFEALSENPDTFDQTLDISEDGDFLPDLSRDGKHIYIYVYTVHIIVG